MTNALVGVPCFQKLNTLWPYKGTCLGTKESPSRDRIDEKIGEIKLYKCNLRERKIILGGKVVPNGGTLNSWLGPF